MISLKHRKVKIILLFLLWLTSWLHFCMRIPANFHSTKIDNIKIFLTFWSRMKQILIWQQVDYVFSPLLIAKFCVEKYLNPLVAGQSISLLTRLEKGDNNVESWSRMWDWVIPPKVSFFSVRIKICWVSDEKNMLSPRVEFTHLTLLTITDYFSHTIQQRISDLYLTWKWPQSENYSILKLCDWMKYITRYSKR